MRTCIGCRKEDEAQAMIRLVLGEAGEVGVDLAGRAFGRGAWVHARSECLRAAALGGASKSFRSNVSRDGGALVRAVREAAERRVDALLGSARASGKVAAGSDVAQAACEAGTVALLLVASDARAAAEAAYVGRAAAAGLATVFGTKERLGRAVARGETAVIAVTDPGIAAALRRAVALSALPEPEARRGGREQAMVEVR